MFSSARPVLGSRVIIGCDCQGKTARVGEGERGGSAVVDSDPRNSPEYQGWLARASAAPAAPVVVQTPSGPVTVYPPKPPAAGAPGSIVVGPSQPASTDNTPLYVLGGLGILGLVLAAMRKS